MNDQEQNTVQTQDAGTEDFATWEAQRNAELTGDSGAGEKTPAAESADESETSGKTEEPEEETSEGDEGDEPEDKPKDEKPKRKGGFQKRIDRLTRENHELAARLAALEKGDEKEAPAKASTDAANDDPKPKSEDFDSFDEFTEAMTDWKIRQREQARAAEETAAKAKAEAENQRKAIGQSYVEQEKAVKAKYADFDEVMEAAEEVEAPQYLLDLLLQAGPEVAYHLAKDLDNAARIAKLGPTAAAREIGKIEATIVDSSDKEPTPKTQPTKKTTSAPKPARSLTGSSAQPKGIDDPNTPYDEWEKARNRQLLQGR